MMRIESSWSRLPQAPNIIVPRHSLLTETPVPPSSRYSIALLSDRGAHADAPALVLGLWERTIRSRAVATRRVCRVMRRAVRSAGATVSSAAVPAPLVTPAVAAIRVSRRQSVVVELEEDVGRCDQAPFAAAGGSAAALEASDRVVGLDPA